MHQHEATDDREAYRSLISHLSRHVEDGQTEASRVRYRHPPRPPVAPGPRHADHAPESQLVIITPTTTIQWERRPSAFGPIAAYHSTSTPSGDEWAIFPEVNRTWALCWRSSPEESWSGMGYTFDRVADAKSRAERDEAKSGARP